MQKMRDIFKNASIKYTGKSYVVLIGVENQSDIHYAIPVKNMFYDVMAYGNQVKETAKNTEKKRIRQHRMNFSRDLQKLIS